MRTESGSEVKTYCFVLQHSTARECDVNVPSGTLTVVRELLKHWDRQARVILLYNEGFGNYEALERLRDDFGVELHAVGYLTVQDRLARLSYVSSGRNGPPLRRLLIRLSAPIVSVRLLRHLRAYLLANRVDVIYSHNGGYPGDELNRMIVLAGRLAHVEHNFLIIHNMGARIAYRKLPLWPFFFLRDRIIGGAATRIVSVSRAAAASLEKEIRFGRDVGWIYNGLSLGDGRGAAGRPVLPAWRKEVAGPVVMFLGALAPRKGLDVLLRALSAVRSSWTLAIYGSGPPEYTAALKAMAARLGVGARVLFLGYDPRAADCIEFCDVLVLPSLGYESFGMVLLEAMRHGKPVVCTDVGGMKEVVEHGRTGLVVAAGDERALAEALECLLEDPASAAAMGRAGHRRLAEKFDVRMTVENYLRLEIEGRPTDASHAAAARGAAADAAPARVESPARASEHGPFE